MRQRLISIIIFIIYCAILIKVMVFKDIPTIRIGQLMLNFAGTDGGHPPNFVPFATIVPYFLGDKGLIIAGINLIGNIALLVPLGFLAPLVFPNMTWKKSLALAVASGLSIETMQEVLRVGIFDIDDVILNALGVMIGYWACTLLVKWIRSRDYKKIGIAVIALITAAAAFYGSVVYPISHQTVSPPTGANGDLCGDTGGIGEIIKLGNNSFTLKRKDNGSLIVNLSGQAAIKTPTGSGTMIDLKTGDRVTLVGGPNPDGSFIADTVLVCGR